jgi:hypothetical protein
MLRATLRYSSTRSRSRASCSRRCPLSLAPIVPMPHSSAILPSEKRRITMTTLVSSLPLGATPISSARSWVACTTKRVTTLSPPATWSSKSTLVLETAAESWAIARIAPSRPGSWPGSSLAWVT